MIEDRDPDYVGWVKVCGFGAIGGLEDLVREDEDMV